MTRTFNPDEERLMMQEWRAWHAVVRQFDNIDLDINDEIHKPLVNAIERWGELLARLRREQPPTTDAEGAKFQELTEEELRYA